MNEVVAKQSADCVGLAFDRGKVIGGYRYRIKTALDPAASAYVAEIEAAKRIMG